MTESLALLKDLVGLPSESGKEDAVLARIESEFSSRGWKAKRAGRSVYAVIGEGDKPLLLVSHADTVPLGSAWTKSPLGELSGTRFFGRGSNDAKASVATMIVGASRAFAKEPPKGCVIVGVTCEEETTNKGVADLLNGIPKPSAAVIGEPTGLQPAVAQKGLLLLTVTAKGKSAHAAWGVGVNAVHAAGRDIVALSKLKFAKAHKVLGKPSLQVTVVAGGSRHNVIPDQCELTLDIRTTPDYTPDEIIGLVEKAVEGQVAVRSKRLLSVDTPLKHRVVRAALAANPGSKPYGSPTVSDWACLKGIPAVKIGPGDSKRSHTADEYVELRELEAGAQFYERMIRAYYGAL